MNTCSTCRYWKPSCELVEKPKGWQVPPEFDIKVCTQGWFRVQDVDQSLYDTTSKKDYCTYQLETKPDFGCVHWEAVKF